MATLPGDFHVLGCLRVQGDLICEGIIRSDIFNIINTVTKDQDARIAELHRDRTALKKRLATLEDRFEELWLAPGMPGALTYWRPHDLFSEDDAMSIPNACCGKPRDQEAGTFAGVHLVEQFVNDDCNVIGVYSTLDRAKQKCAEELQSDLTPPDVLYRITTMQLDTEERSSFYFDPEDEEGKIS